MTVPGTAKHIMVPNSKTLFSANFWRTNNHAVIMPKTAVSGAAIPAIDILVKKDDQAVPLQWSPCSPKSTPKAVM